MVILPQVLAFWCGERLTELMGRWKISKESGGVKVVVMEGEEKDKR